jgi:hypothetical protein
MGAGREAVCVDEKRLTLTRERIFQGDLDGFARSWMDWT